MVGKLTCWALAALLFIASPFARAEDGSSTGSPVEPGAVALFHALADIAEQAASSVRACVPMSDTVYGAYGGYFTMNGTVCDNAGSFDVSYHNFSGGPGVSANGNITMGMSFDNVYNPSSMTLSFDGGPVVYTVLGQTFSISFHEIRMVYGMSYYSVWLDSASGGLTINGRWFSMTDELARFMF